MRYFNLIGDNFTHHSGGNKGYSTHGKKSKHITWVQDGTGEATMYIDASISSGLDRPLPHPKFAWLLESDPMAPQDHVWGFLDADPRYMEAFDLVFTHRRDLLERGDPFRFSPGSCTWIQKPHFPAKNKLVSMITSNKAQCEGHRTRLEWVERLGDLVDLYGRGFQEIESKGEGLDDYMFSVAIENDATPSYFSEKILDCFATGTVPIYLGTPDIGEFFNLAGIITLDDHTDWDQVSEDGYFSRAYAMIDNLGRVAKYRVGEDYIWDNHLRDIWDSYSRF